MTRIVITVELSRVSGLFVSKADLAEAIIEAVQEADLSGLGANSDSEYQVDSVDALETAR